MPSDQLAAEGPADKISDLVDALEILRRLNIEFFCA